MFCWEQAHYSTKLKVLAGLVCLLGFILLLHGFNSKSREHWSSFPRQSPSSSLFPLNGLFLLFLISSRPFSFCSLAPFFSSYPQESACWLAVQCSCPGSPCWSRAAFSSRPRTSPTPAPTLAWRATPGASTRRPRTWWSGVSLDPVATHACPNGAPQR